jgi:[FeFe] hydrogenase (group B1/B3)
MEDLYMEFETRLMRLKYEILKEVAMLAKNDKLTKLELEKIQYRIIDGQKAEYRCCVYKERAVVYQRAQLASGHMPCDNTTLQLVDIQNEDAIIYVLPAACDKCTIDRFLVTEACRNCIEHRCMEVCPANAVTRVGGRAYINQDLCKECGMCKRECPYHAIAEIVRPCKKACPTSALDIHPENKMAIIKQEDCINCGACMNACPFGAISDKSYITNIARALADKREVYAVVAPAIGGQFDNKVSAGMVWDALRKTGFSDVLEAACGADAVALHEGEELVERLESGENYMTSSCCPGFVNYIEKKFPGEVSKISDTVSPMIACGRMLKKEHPGALVVFIGPCTAKKSEINKEDLKGAVDYVMTFEEIAALMGAFDVDVEKCEDVELDQATGFGRNFAKVGGVRESVEELLKGRAQELQLNAVSVSGAEDVKMALMMAKLNKSKSRFIEGMMCSGGCTGGAGTLATVRKSKAGLTKYTGSSKIKSHKDNELLEAFKNVRMSRR